MSDPSVRALALALACLSATACGPSRSPHDPAVRAEALEIWRGRGANCHGRREPGSTNRAEPGYFTYASVTHAAY